MHGLQDRPQFRPPPPSIVEGGQRAEFVCTYDYTNQWDDLQFQKVRYRFLTPPSPARLKTFRYWHGKLGKPAGADALLYRLPSLLWEIRCGESELWIVEGEKDVDTAYANNLIATTTHQGGGPGNKVTAEQAAWFMGYTGRVMVVADKDANGSGYAYAWRWRQQLIAHAALSPGQIRVVVSRVGKDLTEHYERNGGKRWHPVNPERLERAASKCTASRATGDGYGRHLAASPQKQLAKQFEEAGYSHEVARILAHKRAG